MAYDSSTYVEIKGSSQSQPSADAGPVARARPEASPSAAPEIDPLTLTTPRERLEYLAGFLRRLPPERFDMGNWAEPSATRCGTAACIGGWADALFQAGGDAISLDQSGALLGLRPDQLDALCFPAGWLNTSTTPTQGATVLTHLLNTGEVDWSVARKVEA